MDDALRGRLKDAAHTHQPDRARMLARVERGMAEPPAARTPRPRRPAASWVRVVSATAAVAGVVAVGGYAVASAVRQDQTPPQTVATTPDPSTGTDTTPPAPSASPKPSHTLVPPTQRPPSTSGTSDPTGPSKPSGTPPAAGESGAPPPAPPKQGERDSKPPPAGDLLWADGSIDPGSSAYWGQSNITIKAREPLTALTVELRVTQTGQVADAGNWRSLPVEDFDVTVRERGGVLVYRWTLKEGLTVQPGEYVFAGQYHHAEGQRDAGGDSYTVQVDTSDDGPAEWKGDFAPTSR